MSYWSFIKSLPIALRQPTGIATIASVGFHGLLWVVLPVLPLSSKTTESEVQRPVDLVELTPAEQSRLPSFATPQLSLPPLPKTTNLFPSLPSLQSSNSLPSASSSPYNLPLFPPPPTGFSFSPSMPLPAPIGVPTTQIPIPDTPRSSESTQSSKPTIAFQEQPGLDLLQQNSDAFQSQNSPQLPQLEEAAPPPLNPPFSPPSIATDSAPPTTSPTEPSNNSPEQTSPPTTAPTETEQAAAPTTPPPSPGPRPDKIPAEAIARLREAQQRQQELFAYDATGTSNEEASGTLADWTEQTSQSTGKDFKRLELKPSYPTAACPRKLNGQATFGVVVDADGKIVGELARIQSAGYRLLNQKAEEALRAYEFEGTGESQAYLVSLPFTYSSDACAAPSEEAPAS